jgi:hypothetical protein
LLAEIEKEDLGEFLFSIFAIERESYRELMSFLLIVIEKQRVKE